MIARYTNVRGDESRVITHGDPYSTSIALRYLADAHFREPLLVIRGRDLLALPAIAGYRAMAGVVASTIGLTGPVLDVIGRDFEKFRQWQGEFPGLLKYPDR